MGLPEIDETERMTGVVRALQGVTDLPLQIDTSDGRAMEAAMRLYNGKPLINSVNGKQESMDMVFPLVKKYGGVMVALTLDEGGIPETAEGRLRIAEKIVRRAEACGIDRRDILVDALTMTISTGAEAALVTLETVRRVEGGAGSGHHSRGVQHLFACPSGKISTPPFICGPAERAGRGHSQSPTPRR